MGKTKKRKSGGEKLPLWKGVLGNLGVPVGGLIGEFGGEIFLRRAPP